MTALRGAIVTHNLEEIERLITESPNLSSEIENGSSPAELAEKTGNAITFTRTARLTNYKMANDFAEKWLKKYLSVVTSTEYEPLPAGREMEMVWAAVFDGALFKVDRWQRPLIGSPEQAEDIKYLIAQSKISTVEDLREVIKNA